MDITITPGKLKGEIRVIPSKSMAHRLLICAAFSDQPTPCALCYPSQAHWVSTPRS